MRSWTSAHWERALADGEPIEVFQGPSEEGDGPWRLVPCSRCGSLTGHGYVLCKACRLVEQVENKLQGEVPGSEE